MNETHRRHGRCLCGSVTIRATQVGSSVGACHCSMCRTWGGGPLLAVECGADAVIEGGDWITVYPSSEWAERAFCSRCGTHLFYRLKADGRLFLPPGLLENDPALTFDHQIFIDEKPAYYEFANETRNLTGAEVMASFSGEEA
jgi:hypothetical protein